MVVCSNTRLYDVRGPGAGPLCHELMLRRLMVHKVEVYNHLLLLSEVVYLRHLRHGTMCPLLMNPLKPMRPISEMMLTYLRFGPTDVTNKVSDTIGVHATFKFLKELYKYRIHMVVDAEGGDMQVEYHYQCTLRCYLLFFIGAFIFVDKLCIMVTFFIN